MKYEINYTKSFKIQIVAIWHALMMPVLKKRAVVLTRSLWFFKNIYSVSFLIPLSPDFSESVFAGAHRCR